MLPGCLALLHPRELQPLSREDGYQLSGEETTLTQARSTFVIDAL